MAVVLGQAGGEQVAGAGRGGGDVAADARGILAAILGAPVWVFLVMVGPFRGWCPAGDMQLAGKLRVISARVSELSVRVRTTVSRSVTSRGFAQEAPRPGRCVDCAEERIEFAGGLGVSPWPVGGAGPGPLGGDGRRLWGSGVGPPQQMSTGFGGQLAAVDGRGGEGAGGPQAELTDSGSGPRTGQDIWRPQPAKEQRQVLQLVGDLLELVRGGGQQLERVEARRGLEGSQLRQVKRGLAADHLRSDAHLLGVPVPDRQVIQARGGGVAAGGPLRFGPIEQGDGGRQRRRCRIGGQGGLRCLGLFAHTVAATAAPW